MGTPAHMDSSVEFHPQCDKKAPVDLCDRICNWGAQPLISMPRPLVRSSNPALSPSPNLSGYSESPRLYPNPCSVFKKVHPAHMKSLKLTRILPCFLSVVTYAPRGHLPWGNLGDLWIVIQILLLFLLATTPTRVQLLYGPTQFPYWEALSKFWLVITCL